MKSKKEILEKLGISELNAMQVASQTAISEADEIVIISPTGTGKTLAFLLPILDLLIADIDKIQAVIVVPSRELALQIEQVIRDMGTGFKANAVYGGRSGTHDKIDLSHSPAILIATPGRLADHLRRNNVNADDVKYLILDEFDKSLEVGFEKELREIMLAMPNLEKKILTSATQKTSIPEFMEITNPEYLHFSPETESKLSLKVVQASGTDKLDSLTKLLNYLGSGNGIIFCNFKDSIQEVSDFLADKELRHVTFHGSLEQKEREHALIKFRNGTHRLLLATDLAARGIDVPELDFIIHYQLPPKADEFTHRNGRTARMHSSGTAYILKSERERLPDFIETTDIFEIPSAEAPTDTYWETLFITGGRKDKISKGDIAGLFFKEGNLEKGELGTIELKQNGAYVAVPYAKAENLVNLLNNSRLKKKKIRVRILE